jgi:hypothetical protein
MEGLASHALALAHISIEVPSTCMLQRCPTLLFKMFLSAQNELEVAKREFYVT